MLQNGNLRAKFGFDTAENEPTEVQQKITKTNFEKCIYAAKNASRKKAADAAAPRARRARGRASPADPSGRPGPSGARPPPPSRGSSPGPSELSPYSKWLPELWKFSNFCQILEGSFPAVSKPIFASKYYRRRRINRIIFYIDIFEM